MAVAKIFSLIFVLGVLASGGDALKAKATLQTIVTCTQGLANSCSSVSFSECNEKNFCQCNYAYEPASTYNNGNLDSCKLKMCTSQAECQFIFDGNSTCNGNCVCQGGFRLTSNQECVYYDPNIKPLGGECKSPSDCGGGTTCSNLGYCICGVGWAPQNNITCNTVPCDTDHFCRGRVAANSKCTNANTSNSRCECTDEYREDGDTRVCVPRASFLGKWCDNFNPYKYCGYNAACVSGTCKCNFSFKPKANRMDCEAIQCTSNLDCMAQDVNSMCMNGGCTCKSGFRRDYMQEACVPESFTSVTLIVFIVIVSAAIAIATLVFIIKLIIAKRRAVSPNEKTPMKF